MVSDENQGEREESCKTKSLYGDAALKLPPPIKTFGYNGRSQIKTGKQAEKSNLQWQFDFLPRRRGGVRWVEVIHYCTKHYTFKVHVSLLAPTCALLVMYIKL